MCDAGRRGIACFDVLDMLGRQFLDLSGSIFSNLLVVAKAPSLSVTPRVDQPIVIDGQRVRRATRNIYHILAFLIVIQQLNLLWRHAITLLAQSQASTLPEAPGVQQSI